MPDSTPFHPSQLEDFLYQKLPRWAKHGCRTPSVGVSVKLDENATSDVQILSQPRSDWLLFGSLQGWANPLLEPRPKRLIVSNALFNGSLLGTLAGKALHLHPSCFAAGANETQENDHILPAGACAVCSVLLHKPVRCGLTSVHQFRSQLSVWDSNGMCIRQGTAFLVAPRKIELVVLP